VINVEVHMHGNLRRFLPDGAASMHLELPDGALVEDVIQRLGAGHEIWLAGIGKEAVPLATRLVDGTTLDFFPHIDGG
jgi:molybdopterin converting factor small subunit